MEGSLGVDHLAQPSGAMPETRRWAKQLLVREMWAALAIAVIWLAVLFDGLFGPDIVSTNGATSSTVPSVVVLALFASLATWMVAKYGFGHRDAD
jgi:hypothetical protein